jgi:hypothetical protein
MRSERQLHPREPSDCLSAFSIAPGDDAFAFEHNENRSSRPDFARVARLARTDGNPSFPDGSLRLANHPGMSYEGKAVVSGDGRVLSPDLSSTGDFIRGADAGLTFENRFG